MIHAPHLTTQGQPMRGQHARHYAPEAPSYDAALWEYLKASIRCGNCPDKAPDAWTTCECKAARIQQFFDERASIGVRSWGQR